VRLVWFAALGLAACFDAPEFACETDDACVRDGEQGRCELAGYCTFEDDSCAGGRRFAEASSEFSEQCLTISSPCRLPVGAIEAWRLDIPVMARYADQADVVYALDERTALAGAAFSRVAYCLLLDDTFVYTEFDDFTGGNIADTGVPTDAIFKTAISNLTVRTNSPDVSSVESVTGGIEMWPNCYGPGADGEYDGNDTITDPDGARTCYGSFQVHHETTALWAVNKWTSTSEPIDLGIGNSPEGNPDWTFEGNAGDYAVRTLQALIIP